MYFTQEDYRKIEAYLKSKAVRDTSFDSATTPLQGNETIVLVQGGKNVNTTVSDIVSQFFALGVSDFINVTDKYGISYNTLDEAIRVIPWRSRKVGQVITFLNEQGEWHLYQYQGESILTWNNTTLWVDLLESRIVNSILPDQEDLTMTEPDADGNSYMHFKDKDYSIDDFSGLGRVYLRKNLQTLTDPNTGETRLINYLTQTMVGKENVIYHIQYDYNLNGQTIIIPEGCVLLFEGGSISNGAINGYNDYVKSNVLGLKTGVSSAQTNSELLINYINIGLKILLTDTYYFAKPTSSFKITNNINIKGGGIIITESDIFNIEKEDAIINLSNITFDTTLPKTLDSRNRVFITPESVEHPIHINKLIVENCDITNVRLYTQTITDFSKDMGNLTGIDEVQFINCTIKDCGVSVCYLDDVYVGNFIIKNNIITNVGIRVFSRGSNNDNPYAPICKSCIYSGNLAENNKIITTNSVTDYYITPLLLEDFETITISNNTYKNLIIDSNRFHSYSFYIYGRNMYIHNNTMLNVFNLNSAETLNEVFKMKGGLNRYVNNNTFTIDIPMLKSLYPDIFNDYNFSTLRINFMEVGASNECGDYIVRNNTVIVPGILYNSVPTNGVPLTGEVYFESNTIEATTMQGALLALTTDIERTLFFRNNLIKQTGVPYNAFSFLRFLYEGTFKVEITNNTLYNILFVRNLKSDNECTLNVYNNIFYNIGDSLSSDNFILSKSNLFRNNTFIYEPNHYINGNFSASKTIDFESELESITGGFIVLGDMGDSDILIECLGKRGAIYHNCRFTIKKVSDNNFTIYNSDMDSNTYDINVNQDIIPYREPYGLITSPILTLKVVNGKLRLVLGTIKNSKFRILKTGSSLTSYVYNSTFNATDKTIGDFNNLNPYKPIKIYSSNDSSNYYYDSTGRWRNYDGTLVSKVVIV